MIKKLYVWGKFWVADNKAYIRWATVDDATMLVKLNDEFNGIGMTEKAVQESLKGTNELVALAIVEQRIVGFACAQYFRSFCYQDLYGEITELYINEVARGRGLATKLIDFLEEELRNRGVRQIKVITGCKNEVAIKTYERSQYIQDDDIILHKKLRDRK
jgi:ribosomal protein S18 acetylase RimI-like enzyme